jgi:hypothetical protein
MCTSSDHRCPAFEWDTGLLFSGLLVRGDLYVLVPLLCPVPALPCISMKAGGPDDSVWL